MIETSDWLFGLAVTGGTLLGVVAFVFALDAFLAWRVRRRRRR